MIMGVEEETGKKEWLRGERVRDWRNRKAKKKEKKQRSCNYRKRPKSTCIIFKCVSNERIVSSYVARTNKLHPTAASNK